MSNSYRASSQPAFDNDQFYQYTTGSVTLPGTAGGVNSGYAFAVVIGSAWYPSALFLSKIAGVTVDFSCSPLSELALDFNSNMTAGAALWMPQTVPTNGIVPVNYKITAVRFLNTDANPLKAEWVM